MANAVQRRRGIAAFKAVNTNCTSQYRGTMQEDYTMQCESLQGLCDTRDAKLYICKSVLKQQTPVLAPESGN